MKLSIKQKTPITEVEFSIRSHPPRCPSLDFPSIIVSKGNDNTSNWLFLFDARKLRKVTGIEYFTFSELNGNSGGIGYGPLVEED